MQLEELKKQVQNKSFKSCSVEDAIIKGGYKVVRTIKERDSIDCCYRKLGMSVMVIGQNYSYKEYYLSGENPCKNNWILKENNPNTIGQINDSEVKLVDDYSELSITQSIETQQELNNVLVSVLKSIVNSSSVGDKNFIFSQNTPASIWTVIHPLNKKPSVTVQDSAGTIVEGDINYVDNTSLTITFNAPFSGIVILN